MIFGIVSVVFFFAAVSTGTNTHKDHVSDMWVFGICNVIKLLIEFFYLAGSNLWPLEGITCDLEN